MAEQINAVDQLKAPFAAYKALYDQEDLVQKRSQAQEGTDVVIDLDTQRDLLFNALKMTLYADARDVSSPTQADAVAVQKVFLKYKDADKLDYISNTSEVGNLIQDLKLAEIAPRVEALGLTERVERLSTLNLEFDAAYVERMRWVEQEKELGTMKEIRPEVDAAFTLIADSIESIYQVNELTVKDATVKAQLDKLISDLNAFLNKLALVRNAPVHTSGAEKPQPPVTDPTDPHNPDKLPEIKIAEVSIKTNQNMLIIADDKAAFNKFIEDNNLNTAGEAGIVFVEYVNAIAKRLYFYALDSFEGELDENLAPINVGLNLRPSEDRVFVVPYTEDVLEKPYDCFLSRNKTEHLALLNIKKPKELAAPSPKKAKR